MMFVLGPYEVAIGCLPIGDVPPKPTFQTSPNQQTIIPLTNPPTIALPKLHNLNHPITNINMQQIIQIQNNF